MATSDVKTGLARHAVLALGFRPFHLLAGVFAVVALPLWIANYTGILPPGGYLRGVAWHSHEMIFGFATAVMAGFLLTAVRNWTGQATPTGASLAGLAGLWVLARVLALTGPANTAAFVDVLFLPVLGLVIALPIWGSRNTRNFKLLAVLAALTIANLVYHFAYVNRLPVGLTRVAVTAALDVITILMAIIGGRVIPTFTANAVAAARPRHNAGIEIVALGSLVLILAGGILDFWYPLPGPLWGALFLTAAVAHSIRLFLWEPHRTYRDPLLLMLPVAYAWIPISLALRVFEKLAVVPSSAGIHALTLGAIGGLMVAMMMRSALGHTGRPLIAGRGEIAAFVLVQLAAIVRVLAGSVPPQFYRDAVIASAVLWSAAFAVFVLRYGPMLARPRIDDGEG